MSTMFTCSHSLWKGEGKLRLVINTALTEAESEGGWLWMTQREMAGNGMHPHNLKPAQLLAG